MIFALNVAKAVSTRDPVVHDDLLQAVLDINNFLCPKDCSKWKMDGKRKICSLIASSLPKAERWGLNPVPRHTLSGVPEYLTLRVSSVRSRSSP